MTAAVIQLHHDDEQSVPMTTAPDLDFTETPRDLVPMPEPAFDDDDGGGSEGRTFTLDLLPLPAGEVLTVERAWRWLHEDYEALQTAALLFASSDDGKCRLAGVSLGNDVREMVQAAIHAIETGESIQVQRIAGGAYEGEQVGELRALFLERRIAQEVGEELDELCDGGWVVRALEREADLRSAAMGKD